MPGFCTHPTDTVASFKGLARTLGMAISDRPDLRLIVCQALRRLINKGCQTGKGCLWKKCLPSSLARSFWLDDRQDYRKLSEHIPSQTLGLFRSVVSTACQKFSRVSDRICFPFALPLELRMDQACFMLESKSEERKTNDLWQFIRAHQLFWSALWLQHVEHPAVSPISIQTTTIQIWYCWRNKNFKVADSSHLLQQAGLMQISLRIFLPDS